MDPFADTTTTTPAHNLTSAQPQRNYGTVPSPQAAGAGPGTGTGVGHGDGNGIGPETGPETGTGIGTGVGQGTSIRPSQSTQFHAHFQHNNNSDNEQQDRNRSRDMDAISIATISSYSTYSSTSSTTSGSPLHDVRHESNNHGEECNNSKVSKMQQQQQEEEKEEEDETTEMTPSQLFWTYVILTPVLLSILALFAGLLQLLPSSTDSGVIVHWDQFCIGMLGWAISFGARTPIYAIVAKYVTTDPDLSEWYTLLPAAFVEETVRLVVIWITAIGPDFGAVFWLGLGWAGLETVYYIGQSLVYSRYWYSPSEQQQQQQQQQQNHLIGEQDSLLRQHHIGRRGQQQQHHHHHLTKDVEDPVEAKEVRHLLGIDRPWWSLMGRTSSMMVHIGLGCWIGHSGLKLLLPAAIVHGALYIVWGVFIEHWSVPATSYGTFMSAMGIFLVGLALYGEIV